MALALNNLKRVDMPLNKETCWFHERKLYIFITLLFFISFWGDCPLSSLFLFSFLFFVFIPFLSCVRISPFPLVTQTFLFPPPAPLSLCLLLSLSPSLSVTFFPPSTDHNDDSNANMLVIFPSRYKTNVSCNERFKLVCDDLVTF